MKPDLDKIDDAVLALLHLTSFTEGRPPFKVTRAWKGHDWDALARLHAQGYISDPVGKAKSVVLTEEGVRRAEELFAKLFCAPNLPGDNLKSQI
ncbi:MAG: hypothetical protein KIS67_12045 [Verrucomicrobiae bacterium]|nr:hypothetical protein [Verrucomicrobiae bacterium]